MIWNVRIQIWKVRIQMCIDAYIILPYLVWKKKQKSKLQSRIDFYWAECTPNYKIEKRLLELSSKL